MIRTATKDDIPRIVALGRLLHLESDYRDSPFDDNKVATLMASLIDGAGVIFVSEIDGVVVGGLAGGISEQWFGPEKIAFDYSFFLAKEARHGASAVRLIVAFAEWSRLRGASKLRMGITTGIQPEKTARLYRGMGMADAGMLFQMEL